MSGKEAALGIPKGATSSFPAEPGVATDWCWLDTQGHTWLDGSSASWLDGVVSTPAFPDAADYYEPTVASSPYAVFDLRKRVSAYSGDCINVRRASDNTNLDIGFDANGHLDVDALETFCAGTDGFVETWYAQGGTVEADLTQLTDGNQPQIVSNGSVLTTSHGHPYIRFNGKSLTATLTSTVSTANVDWIMVVQDGNTPGNGGLTSNGFGKVLQVGTDSQHISFQMADQENIDSFFGNGGSSVRMSAGDGHPSVFTGVWPAVWAQRCQYDDATIWRDGYVIDSIVDSDPGSVSVDDLQVGEVGAGDFQLVSLALYPRLSEADHSTIQQNENEYHSFHGIAPGDINGSATVIQRFDFHATLYDWLEARTTSDFTLTRSSLSSDGTYTDNDELLQLYLFLQESFFDVLYGLRADDEWYVLDNGDGRGLETSSLGQVSFTDPADGGMSNNCAAWYAQHIPLTGGGEGNPYYQQAALGRRALALAAWDFMLYDTSLDAKPTNNQQIPFVGGNLDSVTGAFRACEGLLDATTRQAFIDAFQWWIRLSRAQGPTGANSNIDTKYIAGVCRIYEYLDDRHKSIAVDSVKRLLFGAADGTAATTNANGNYGTAYGIAGLAGSIVEGGGYESNYNGRSLRHICDGYSWVESLAEWSFLEGVIQGICEHMTYQTFPDTGDRDGPTDYASRTGGSIWNHDQDAMDMRQWVAAAATSSGYPLLRYKGPVETVATMVSGIQSGATSKNTDFSSATSVSGTAAAHTNGIDYSITWAADTGTDELVITGTNPFSVDDRVAVYSSDGGAGVPSGLDDDTLYWVVASSGQRIQVSTTQSGSAVVLSESGSGTLYFQSIVYLTDTPDLSDFSLTDQRWYVTIGSTTGLVVVVDDSADYVVTRAAFNIASGSPQNYIYGLGPLAWNSNRTWWPSSYQFFPPDGTYDTVKALVDANDTSTQMPWEATASFNRNPGSADHFWHYKTTGNTPDYGWMIHCPEDPGDYKGFYGGTLSCFWTDDYGMAIVGKHDKSGEDTPSENTRVWAEIEQWAVQHWWGRDTNTTPLRWSTATLDSDGAITPSATTTFDINGTPKKVTHAVTFGMGDNKSSRGGENTTLVSGTSAAHTNGTATRTITLTNTPDLSGLNTTQNDYYLILNGTAITSSYLIASVDDGADTVTLDVGEPTQNISSGAAVNYEIRSVAVDGTLTITKVWEERSGGDGIKVTETLTSDQVDYMTEMWATIPCLLQRDGQSGTDANIEYWDGGTWLPVSTSLTSGVDWIRCRRDVSGTDEFIWINFSGGAQSIKRPTSPYVADYQGDTRILPVFVDMLGYTGSAVQLGASTQLVWEATTTDPGLTPTNPVASITYPTATDNMPVGRQWAVQAGVTWYGSSSFSVVLKYSDDNQSSWNTVGSMTLTSGTPGSTACVYEYFDGSIPSGVTDIRIAASDDVGTTEAGTEVTIGSTTYTQVVNDPFTGTDATTLGSSYSGFTTNTTGNNYVDTNPPEIQSNAASCSTDDPTYAQATSIKVLANGELNDFIVEADVASNTATNVTPTKAPGIHCRMRDNSALNLVNTGLALVLDVSGGGGDAAKLLESGTQKDILSISGYSTGTVYRLSLDCRQNIVIYQVRNSSTDAVISDGVIWDASFKLSDNDGKNAGVSVFKESAVSSDTADDFKVWIP